MAQNAELVGRHAELGRVGELVSELAEGRGAAAWVEGEAGIGKSAFVAAALAPGADLGVRVMWSAGDEPAQMSSLGLLAGCLGARRPGADEQRDEVARL
ncbi:MAG TPA: hypothetical protein VEJ84_18920, partial [Acidimicrobiales bacterium]|nr:hypothetical protein [Acidimicrobiales bacterium]